MLRSISVFAAEGKVEGRHAWFYCFMPDKKTAPKGDQGRWHHLTDISLRDDEVWTDLFHGGEEQIEPGISVVSKSEKPVEKETPESMRNWLVQVPFKLPRLYLFELEPPSLRLFRNNEGKPATMVTTAFAGDSEGAKLPKGMGEWKFQYHIEEKEGSHWKGDVVRGIKEEGFKLWEIERVLPEDKEPLYFFISKDEPERLGDDGVKSLWQVQVVFTKDIFGANLPVWFRKSAELGTYPERAKGQDWNLKNIRDKLKTEDYVLGHMKMEVAKSTTARDAAAAQKRAPIVEPATNRPSVSDPMAVNFADKIWERLKK